jgi:hypothetical protein
MGRRSLSLLAAVTIALAAATIASSATTPGAGGIPKTLHEGMRGPRVGALQWLLTGHPPSRFLGVRTYRGRVDGIYGHATALAVWNMKWRLGYPRARINYAAGATLLNYLLGREARTLQMISIAAVRAKRLIQQRTAETSTQRRLLALERSQLGVHEIPDGSNRGPRISYPVIGGVPSYQSSTGAYAAPWCASFQQWTLLRVLGHGLADRSAGVFYIKDWAWRHGLVHAIPKPTDLVAFVDGSGHIGMVETIGRTGFWSLEGNEGNAVRRVWHPFRSQPMVFITTT